MVENPPVFENDFLLCEFVVGQTVLQICCGEHHTADDQRQRRGNVDENMADRPVSAI